MAVPAVFSEKGNCMFHLGQKSLAELQGVHPDVVRIVKRAIQITETDFTVFDGIRTAADQNALYRRGASQIDGFGRIGKHQAQADGFGWAVDLVPWKDGHAQWLWPEIYLIADAMTQAARECDVPLRWGGCWQVVNDLAGAPEHWVAAYVKRKRDARQRAFNDGPHWELCP